MPRKRFSMRQVYDVLRLQWAVGLSDCQIAHSLGLSRPTVVSYVHRAQAAGLSWPLPAGLDEATQIAPTAVASATGQPWRLRPSSMHGVLCMHIGYVRRPTRAMDGRGLAPHETCGFVGCSILPFPSTILAWLHWNASTFLYVAGAFLFMTPVVPPSLCLSP